MSLVKVEDSKNDSDNIFLLELMSVLHEIVSTTDANQIHELSDNSKKSPVVGGSSTNDDNIDAIRFRAIVNNYTSMFRFHHQTPEYWLLGITGKSYVTTIVSHFV
jgi:hypothetical protein